MAKRTSADLDVLGKAYGALCRAEAAFAKAQAPINARAELVRGFVLKNKKSGKLYKICWLWPDRTHALYVRGLKDGEFWHANLDEFEVTEKRVPE